MYMYKHTPDSPDPSSSKMNLMMFPFACPDRMPLPEGLQDTIMVFKKYCEIRMITHKEGAVLVGDQSSVIDTDLTAKETT